MKKIFMLVLISFFIFFIYIKTIDKKIYYLSLGDALSIGLDSDGNYEHGFDRKISSYLSSKKILEISVTEFSDSSNRTTDLINMIKDNKKISKKDKKISIKNALVKADFTTISVGLNDYIYYLNVSARNMYSNINIISLDIKELLTILKEYSKEDIAFIGIYNPYTEHPNLIAVEENLKILNKNIKALCKSMDIFYIDIYDEMKNPNYLKDRSIYPTKEGYNMIFEKIKEILDDKTLKK